MGKRVKSRLEEVGKMLKRQLLFSTQGICSVLGLLSPVSVLVVLGVFLGGAHQAWATKLLSTNVGQVGKATVTSREVHLNYLVERAIYQTKKKKPPTKIETLKSKTFARETATTLLEWTVYFEAKELNAVSVSESDIARALAIVKKSYKNRDFWKRFDFGFSEIKQLVRRKIIAKKFIRFKVESSSVPITDKEAQEYFENNRLKFGNMPFENFKKNIKAYLARQQVDRRLKDWFEVLQAKYKIKNQLADY